MTQDFQSAVRPDELLFVLSDDRSELALVADGVALLAIPASELSDVIAALEGSKLIAGARG